MTTSLRIAAVGCVSALFPVHDLHSLLFVLSNTLLILKQGHGQLHHIYEMVEAQMKLRNWDTVDCVIVGGDFQVCSLLLHGSRCVC